MRLILAENSFKFNDKHYLQTVGIEMGTQMAVAFSVIFMAHIEKQLLNASPYKPFLWRRFIDNIFSVRTTSETEINKNCIDFANSFQANIKFTHEMSSKHIVFLDTEVLKDHDSFKVKYLMFRHILSQQKHSSTRISPHATLSVLRRALKEKLYAYFERTRLRNHRVKEERILNSRYRTRLPLGTRRNNPSRGLFRITQNGFTK